MTEEVEVGPDYGWGWDGMDESHMHSKMKKGWKCAATPCGAGSTRDAARKVSYLLPTLVQQHQWTSIADVGAGDRLWMQHVNLPSPMDYDAFDLVPRHDCVEEFDCTKDMLPRAYDLILCRHVLNHISPRMARDALKLFQDSGSKYLLMTNCGNQRRYWRAHGLYPMSEDVPLRWSDTTKWELELYRLADIRLP